MNRASSRAIRSPRRDVGVVSGSDANVVHSLQSYGTRLFATAATWATAVTVAVAADPKKPELNITTPKTFQDSKGIFFSVDNAIASGFNIVLTVSGILFMVLFLLGGVQYLASAGNEEGTKKARQLMLDAVIGLAIVVMAWAVGTYVLQLFGLSGGPSLRT